MNKRATKLGPAAFVVHAGHLQARAGLSLRGHCCTPEAAQQLAHALNEVISYGQPLVWVDCQSLASLSWHGQRAIYNAHQRARVAGTGLYWCGLAPAVLHQLADTGLHLLLSLLPAEGYRGPGVLLQEVVPQVHYLRRFAA